MICSSCQLAPAACVLLLNHQEYALQVITGAGGKPSTNLPPESLVKHTVELRENKTRWLNFMYKQNIIFFISFRNRRVVKPNLYILKRINNMQTPEITPWSYREKYQNEKRAETNSLLLICLSWTYCSSSQLAPAASDLLVPVVNRQPGLRRGFLKAYRHILKTNRKAEFDNTNNNNKTKLCCFWEILRNIRIVKPNMYILKRVNNIQTYKTPKL